MASLSYLRTLLTSLLFLIPAAALASDLEPDSNQSPRADAGLARSVMIGEIVILDATGSTDVDGDGLNYHWTLQTPAGSAARLSDAGAPRPQFTVDLLGEYTAELVVNDGKLDSVADRVTIRTGNVAPVAIADADRTVEVGVAVMLDAGASWDFNGDPLDFNWSVIEAPAGSRAALQLASSVKPMFTTDVSGNYVFELTVSDGQFRSEATRVRLSTVNSRPQADAGPDRSTYSGTRIRLDGRSSTDADDQSLNYRWSLLHAPRASRAALSATNSALPVLNVDAPGLYVIQLIADDGVQRSEPDTMVITSSAPTFITTATGTTPATTAPRGVLDTDGDGVPDDSDNCVEDFNPSQLDTNGDGFGNQCDADLDNDGLITNFGDLAILRGVFFTTPASPNWNPDADFNGDNVVNFIDLQVMNAAFFGPPGPIVNRFINPAGGSWHEPANWSLGIVPNAAHSARIDIGAGVTVAYSTGISEIAGLRGTTDFTITGGSLRVRGIVQVNAAFAISGNGILADANVLAPATPDQLVLPAFETFTLDNVTLGADLTIEPGGSLYVDDELTLDGATITLASDNNFTYLRFRAISGNTATLGGNGNVVYGGTATVDNRNVIAMATSLDGLVIGSGVTIRSDTAAGRIFHQSNNGPVTIQGTVISDVSGRTVAIDGVPLSIEGSLQASNTAVLDVFFRGTGGTIGSSATLSVDTGGELQLRGDWVSEGTITVTDGVLDLGNALSEQWQNNGTITLSNATLELGGSYTVADIGTVTGTGTVILNGSLDNTSMTLDVGADLPGTTVLLGNNGVIVGGSIVNTPLVLPAFITFTLDNVTLGADLTIEPGGSLYVDDELTLDGATITLASDNNFTYLRFRAISGNTATLGGNGNVVYGGTATVDNRNVIAMATSLDGLVIGSGVTIRSDTAAGRIFHQSNNGPVTIQGTVISDVSGRTVAIDGVPLSIEGSLQASNTAVLDVFFRGTGGTIGSSATLSVDTGGELQLRGDWVSEGTITVTDGVLDLGNALSEQWQNNGTITLSNATLELGGSYTVADIGTVTGTGTVILNGSLDNTSMTLDVGADLPGTTVLLGNNGVIVGGSIVNTPLVLPAFITFTLDNVTLGADLTIEPGGSLYVDDELTLDGATITLASDNNFTYLRFRAISGNTATLGGNGNVVYGGTATVDNRNVIAMATSLDGLVIGSGVTIRSDTAAGRIFHQSNNGPVTIQGTVISDVSGRTVAIDGVPLSIEGSLQASNTAVLDVFFRGTGGTIGSSATLSVDTGGELQLRGDWVSEGTITVTDGVLDLGNALSEQWQNNGTITLSNATLELGGSYTVADIGTVTGTGTVILNGSLDNTSMTLDVGADLPGTTVLLGNNGVIVGGSIVNTPLVLPAFITFTLDNVTLGADLTIEPGGSLYVDDELTLDGATITLASDNNFTYLRFRAISGNTATLGGNGNVVYGGTATVDNRNVIAMATSLDGLVIGSGVTIRSDTAAGRIFHQSNNGPVTIQGTVISDVSGRTVAIDGVPLSIEGSLQASNTAVLDVFFRGTGGTIGSSATLSVDTGGELQLRGDWVSEGTITVTDGVLDLGNALSEQWQNNGTITLSNATLELGGSYTVADIGTVTGTGTVILNGSLDNTSMTLDVGADLPGTTVLLGNNGVIVGGSIVNTPLVLPAFITFTLDNVTLGADLTIEPGGSLYVDDELTLDGATITLASDNNFTYLRFRAISGNTATLGGNGNVVYGGTATVDNRNVIAMATSLDGLVIGSGVTIRSDTAAGRIYHQSNNGPVTIQGTVISDVSGRTVAVGGTPLSIEGNLQAAAGSVINFTSDYSLSATAQLDVAIGGTATTDFGRFTAAGRTASLDGVVNMTLVNAFTPVLSNTFEIMTFAARNGTIAAGTGTTIGGGLSFQVNNNTTDVTLEVVN